MSFYNYRFLVYPIRICSRQDHFTMQLWLKKESRSVTTMQILTIRNKTLDYYFSPQELQTVYVICLHERLIPEQYLPWWAVETTVKIYAQVGDAKLANNQLAGGAHRSRKNDFVQKICKKFPNEIQS